MASDLLRLPNEVLYMIWRKMRHVEFEQPQHAAQHALRCTCTAVRDACSAWISVLDIRVLIPIDIEHVMPAKEALRQLDCCPKPAQLHTLGFYCHSFGCVDTEIPSFFKTEAARARLFSLHTVDLQVSVSL